MDALRTLEGASLSVKLQLQSLDYLESKSPQLVQVLDTIRNILEFDQNNERDEAENSDRTTENNETDIEQIQVQKLFRMLIRIRNISIDSDEREQTENERDDSDSQCTCFVKIINSIIDNNSAVKQLREFETESVASTSENHYSHSSRKRKTVASNGNDTETVSATAEEHYATPDNSRKKPKPKPSMEAALEIDVVLTEIFRYSTISDVKVFRRVNRKWNETASSVLLSKKSLHIVLDVIGSSSGRRFLKIQNRSADLGSLHDLGTLMESSPKFPCTSLVLLGGKPHGDEGFKKFLSKHGHYFKEFRMDLQMRYDTSLVFLLDLLETYSPNLETFEMDDTKVDFNICCREDMSMPTLPNLKKLVFKPQCSNTSEEDATLHDEFKFFQSLLKAAVNLQSIETFGFNYLEEVINTNKQDLIRTFQYRFIVTRDGEYSDSSFAIVDRLMNLNVKLSCLVILLGNTGTFGNTVIIAEEPTITITKQLNAILNGSKDTLRSIRTDALGTFPGISFPQLPNLDSLVIDRWRRVSHNTALFPPSFSFSKHMPNLRKITLSFKNFDGDSVKSCIPWDQTGIVCNSVEYLEIEGFIFNTTKIGNFGTDTRGAKMVAKMFPNVKCLKIRDNWLTEIRQLNPVVWHFCSDGLRSLEIYGLQCTEQPPNTTFVDIVDPFFTGISMETCRILRDLPTDRFIVPEMAPLVNLLRTRRSIYDLKELQELNIFCSSFTSNAPIASHVTGMCAFGLMPNLKVTVNYRLDADKKTTSMQVFEDCLKPIASYVHLKCSQRHQPHE